VLSDGCEKGINGGHERGIVASGSVRSDAEESVTPCIVYREEAPILGAGFCCANQKLDGGGVTELCGDDTVLGIPA
jgi:hypothetical protein